MKQQQRIQKFKQVIAYLKRAGLFEKETVDYIACPESDKIVARLLRLGGDNLSPKLLAEAFAAVFDLEIYSPTRHGTPICRDEVNDVWLYADGKLFLSNPFISPPSIRTLLNSETLAKVPLKGYGILPVAESPGARTTVSYQDNDYGVAARKIVMKWLEDAVQAGASDLQIIPTDDNGVFLKQRIDGKLHPLYEWTHKNDEGILYKHLCNVILNECKQVTGTFNRLIDSRFKVTIQGQATEVRVSMRPIFVGEVNKPAFFLRFFGTGHLKTTSIGDLKLYSQTAQLLRDMTATTDGMCVFTGPTGSGKTATIYTILSEIHRRYPYKSIQTLEDPVERNLSGVEQTQVDNGEESLYNNGLNFESGIRSMMRTDVDLILVGEIRDSQTARQAMRAGLTGHGVLTTLHTIDALGVIDRLVDLGIERAQIASWLRYVSAQRLVTEVCTHCAKELPAQSYYRHLKYRIGADQKVRIANPDGCSHCRAGYRGRRLLMEVIRIDDSLQKLIDEGASVYEMRIHVKRDKNYMLLEDYALQLWLDGVTTLEAIADILGYSWGVAKDSLAKPEKDSRPNLSADANGCGLLAKQNTKLIHHYGGLQ